MIQPAGSRRELLGDAALTVSVAGVAVTVRRGAEQLRVEVVDDGDGPQDQPAGFGLRGMRERVAAVGGTLETGAGAPHGYAVRACIPMGDLPPPVR